ncbi:MAG: radical SAM superfamily enzyme YgiQ (UPF0313 family) [Flavobacteriales bacterium]|jgi:radical SAM superfamily enzyme YgiQ (UPF0313 family)
MPGRKILLLIPPLTQLNTPYPSTAYLTGFLAHQGVDVRQGDLGLDMVLDVFCNKGLVQLFDQIEAGSFTLDNHLKALLSNRQAYEESIDAVIAFLQNKNYTLAYRIAGRNYLPEGGRFAQLDDLEWFFGNIGSQDQARYLCTLYLEDLGDLIQATVGPQFGFSKYAERIARTASSFDKIHAELLLENNYFDTVLLRQATSHFDQEVPDLVGLSVPFPGNLYGALKVGQWIKKHHPNVVVAMGGGYPNTELRDLSDPAVFDFVDYITLDDGEAPIMALHANLDLPESDRKYKRTFTKTDGKVEYLNNHFGSEYKHKDIPAPSYRGLNIAGYLSMFDVPNPMHRLWNDGRWNKMTIAHGCYWKKCSFCDITLDYISRYNPAPAANLVDKMETLMAETGESGFHFVDEAAPPLIMRDMAIEILRRGLQVTWWTNIRFEKTFSPDICKLLAASGCIAVTGGLEVASERLLEKMEKGITIAQVSRVCKAFHDAGIMVHSYLMYGFPTETEQETIDSLEVVRQLFKHKLIQSGFWHQFAMTAHSPVGKDPDKYGVIRTGPEFKGFAQNDLYHEDPTGADHQLFSEGLKAALYNYMHDNGFEFPLQDFFDFPIPHKTVASGLVKKYIKGSIPDWPLPPGYRVGWYRVAFHSLASANDEESTCFVSSNGQTVIHLPCAIFKYFMSNKEKMDVRSSEILDFHATLKEWAELLNMTPETIVTATWWVELRKSVLWVFRS